MERRFTVIIELDEDGYYVGSVLELPGCHTQARTLEALMERIKEAIELYLETMSPPTPKTEFIGVHRIALT
jgi:predicted RNase H-like HicB family nuclease